MKINRADKAACKRMAADVRLSLHKYTNVSLSALNYGIGNSPAVLDELRRLLPNVTASAEGFMGYIRFVKEEPDATD